MGKKKYEGKYAGARVRRKMPALSAALIVAAALTALVGGVAAYLSLAAGGLENTFQTSPAADPSIQEVFDGNSKSDVAVVVEYPGYAVYVRAAVIVTWKAEDGTVLGQNPVKDTDYTMRLGGDWFEHEGFYYYKEPVASAGVTETLIESCKPLTAAPLADYALNVEIVAQTVQALGTTDGENKPAVTDAWEITVDNDGMLIDPSNP